MTHGEVTVGIVTALPVESAAVRLVVDDLREGPATPGDPNRYQLGTIPSIDGARPHRVAIALQAYDGTRNAAAVATSLARSFPGLRTIVMCGIAGAIPAPRDPGRHVRLGDVVVATGGIIDYAHVRLVDGEQRLRRPLGGMSTRLLMADRELEADEHLEVESWYEMELVRRPPPDGFARPADATDVLTAGDVPVPHPDRRLSRHRPGRPRVHRGLVGSADMLLRDELARDRLAAEFGILAVEMEGSGIAVGANVNDLPWFMVRGAADYCANSTKNDLWHGYASWVAAAYVRALLGRTNPFTASNGGPSGMPDSRGLQALIDALVGIPALRDDYRRRAVMDLLPAGIRAAVNDSTNGRLHLIALIQTCADRTNGREILLDTLELAFGSDSPEFHRARESFEKHWGQRAG